LNRLLLILRLISVAQKANPAFIENCSKLRKIRSALEAAAIAKEQELANQRLLEEQYTFILSTFEFLQDSVQEVSQFFLPFCGRFHSIEYPPLRVGSCH
jgi:hypothetical protein